MWDYAGDKFFEAEGKIKFSPVYAHDLLLLARPTTQCTTCWCPKAQLSDPDALFPFRNAEEVREKVAAEVAAERRRLFRRDGTPRDRCKAEVCYIRSKFVIY